MKNFLITLLLLSLTLAGCILPQDNDPVIPDDDDTVGDDDSADDDDSSSGDDDSAGDDDSSANNTSDDDDSEEVSPITWTECGGRIGDHPCDFTFQDHNGVDWNLYDNYGTVMVLDFSTVWCYWCQVAAAQVQTHMDLYGHEDFVWVTVLIEDVTGSDVDVSEALQWANDYGIVSAPVLAGDRSIIDTSAEAGFPVTGWPTMVIIDREMIISKGIRGWSETQMIAWIEEELGL